MPVIRVSLSDLENLLGKRITLEELYRGLTKLKCEVEGIQGDIVEYEANHDRPDLFSSEGVARALRPFLGVPPRRYDIVESSSVEGYAEYIPERPYIALAVVRNLELSDEAVSQIMQLQEKLALTYGRGRRKASIGVYDLDKVSPPIYYRLVDPDTTTYKPLNETREMTLREVLYETEKGRLYGYIIESMKKYPVLMDSAGEILSLAPILNSDHNKVTTSTRNILIDSTGVDPETVVDMVTVMAMNIVERSRSGVIEAVRVHYPDGSVIEAPRRKGRVVVVNINDVNELLGTSMGLDELREYLSKHYYIIEEIDSNSMRIEAPVYRLDVKTWVDVAEDVAIAYGYHNLGQQASSFPPSLTIGKIHPLEYLSRGIRDVMVGLGFTEIANYMMSSIDAQVSLLSSDQPIFVVENPKSERFTAVRTWLTPGLLETIMENAGKKARLSVFEIGDVVIPDPSMDTGARIERRLGIAISHDKATLTDGLAVIKALFNELGLAPRFSSITLKGFLEGRTVSIAINGESTGFIGEIDPRILYRLGMENPVVIGEVVISKIINWLK